MYQIRLCAQGAEGDSLAQVLAALDLVKGRLMAGAQGGNGREGSVTFEFEVREVDAEHRLLVDGEELADPVARLMRDPHQAHLLGLLAKEGPGGITRIMTSSYFEYEVDGETYVLLDPERRKLEEQLGEALLERVYPGYAAEVALALPGQLRARVLALQRG